MSPSADATRKAETKSWARIALLLLLLASFIGIQTASAVTIHPHEHEGPHSHCCVACHAGHLPATQAAAPLGVILPSRTEWRAQAEDYRNPGQAQSVVRSCRAPPVASFSSMLFCS